jgi:hypothetical protein
VNEGLNSQSPNDLQLSLSNSPALLDSANRLDPEFKQLALEDEDLAGIW